MGTRLPLRSEIPATHPHKAVVESRFRRLLQTLGRSWRLTIDVDEDAGWNVCLRQESGDRTRRLWCTCVSPSEQNPQALETWLRSLARRLQDELGLDVGVRPIDRLADAGTVALARLVALYAGSWTADGFIVVPRRARPAFVAEAEALGIALEIGMWTRGGRVPVKL